MKNRLLLLLSLLIVDLSGLAPASAADAMSANLALKQHFQSLDTRVIPYQAALVRDAELNQQTSLTYSNWPVTQVLPAYSGKDLSMSLGKRWNDVSYDFGYVFYGSASQQGDFAELHAALAWDFISVGIAKTAHAKQGSAQSDDTYIEANFTFEILQELKLGLHVGSLNQDRGKVQQDYNVSFSKNGLRFVVSKIEDDAVDDEYRVIFSYQREIRF